jgi:molybdenum cofactor cytidylyltransferase
MYNEIISIPGIILAAGRSQRMGKNKLLLMFRGKPILQHVIDAAQQSSLSPLILVLGANSDAIRSQIDPGTSLVVENPDFVCGYGSSLQVGLKQLSKPCAGAMFLLGDQPLLTTQTIEKLIAAFQEEPERWVAPSWKGQRGNPVITPASWFDRIFALKGDTGPREHLKDPAANLKLINVDDRGVIFDIDSPEDYEHLINR